MGVHVHKAAQYTTKVMPLLMDKLLAPTFNKLICPVTSGHVPCEHLALIKRAFPLSIRLRLPASPCHRVISGSHV